MKKGNKIIGWLLVIVLIAMILGLNYVKFIMQDTEDAKNIKEVPIKDENSDVIKTALKEIVNNFNENSKIEEYKNQNIKIEAVLNNYTIFITYETDTRITYEFNYNNLELKISIQNETENLERFNKIYEILIYAVQKRLNNDSNIQEYINDFLNNNKNVVGITKENEDQNIIYTMNITKKINENIIESKEGE